MRACVTCDIIHRGSMLLRVSFRAGMRVLYNTNFSREEIFAIFANWDFARNFPHAKIISTANGISRNFPPAKFSSREIVLPVKIKF